MGNTFRYRNFPVATKKEKKKHPCTVENVDSHLKWIQNLKHKQAQRH